MNQHNPYGWYDDEEGNGFAFDFSGDLPEPDTEEPIVCPQCWDTKKYNGDKISEITKSMCKGIR